MSSKLNPNKIWIALMVLMAVFVFSSKSDALIMQALNKAVKSISNVAGSVVNVTKDITSKLTPEELKEDAFNVYRHVVKEVQNITESHVKPEHVTFYLYTKENFEHPVQIRLMDSRSLEHLSGKKCTFVLIIHGWTGSRANQWYEQLTQAFLLREDHQFCVIQVDWEEPASYRYSLAAYNTKDVGELIGDFIVTVHQKKSIPLNQFLLVGHSLGGHVSGFAGKTVQSRTHGRKLDRIIALDPAGPLFNHRPGHAKLNHTDAKEVIVIHTDGGILGYKAALGTLDFFPNGGSTQPGCARVDLASPSSIVDPLTCDHQRAHQYFVEAVLNPKEFNATKCDTWDHFMEQKCDEAKHHERLHVATLGNFLRNAVGKYFLQTNGEKPYAKRTGKMGVIKLLQSI